MATALYNTESELVHFHDSLGDIMGRSNSGCVVDGKPFVVSEDGRGSLVEIGRSAVDISDFEQGEVKQIGDEGYAIYKKLIGKDWYITAPVLALFFALFRSAIEPYETMFKTEKFCGLLPLVAVGTVWLARRWQIKRNFPSKLNLED